MRPAESRGARGKKWGEKGWGSAVGAPVPARGPSARARVTQWVAANSCRGGELASASQSQSVSVCAQSLEGTAFVCANLFEGKKAKRQLCAPQRAPSLSHFSTVAAATTARPAAPPQEDQQHNKSRNHNYKHKQEHHWNTDCTHTQARHEKRRPA